MASIVLSKLSQLDSDWIVGTGQMLNPALGKLFVFFFQFTDGTISTIFQFIETWDKLQL